MDRMSQVGSVPTNMVEEESCAKAATVIALKKVGADKLLLTALNIIGKLECNLTGMA